MAVWLSYSLSDFLLFSPRTYYRLFELTNLALWPLHLLAATLGLLLVVLLHGRQPWRGRVIAAVLALIWAWVAWAYLLERYATINWAASYFAIGFAVQAALLALSGIGANRFKPAADPLSRSGRALVVFALVIQPLAAPLCGRALTQLEFFGIAPDPTVTATIGVLLALPRVPWLLLVIPLLWCAITGLTLWAMEAPDALVMPAVAVFALAVAAGKSWKRCA